MDNLTAVQIDAAQKERAFAVYIDLIEEFDRLCRKHDITWWVIAGTLLGAVRHQGFIPWDDDVDILLPRRDFDRLLRLSNGEFGARPPYFLQTPHTDARFQQRVLRFRRSDTAYLTAYDLKMAEKAGGGPYDMGIALGIFPLDNVPKGDFYRKMQLRIASSGVSYRTEDNIRNKKPVLTAVYSAVEHIVSEKMIVRGIQEMYRICRRNRSGLVQSFAGFYGGRNIWPLESFSETVMLPFENITVPAPAGYDAILRASYGDYMQPPPPEQRVEKHACFLSADIPWPEALAILDRGEIDIGI